MHDVVIIGSGPAGLTTLLYSRHYGFNAVVVGSELGGRLMHAPDIIDYPGYSSVQGKDFINTLQEQLKRVNSEVMTDKVTGLLKDTNHFKVTTEQGKTLEATAVVIATGNGKKQRENTASLLASQVGATLQDGSIVVNEKMATNVPGIFACGDCVIYPHSMEQLATATAAAIQAAGSVYEYLKKERPPILWGAAQIRRA
jgi:thioredoxin reductase